MREDSSGRLTSSSAEGLKTEELRVYEPEEHCPKERLGLLKKRVLIVANGEVYGSFRLGAARHCKSRQQMAGGSGRHWVTRETAPGGEEVTTSCTSFVTKAFPRGGSKRAALAGR